MADYGVRITLSASSPVPTYNAAPWVNGVAKLSAGAPASGWTSGQLIEVSPVGERVDIAQGGNYAEVSSFDCTLSATWWLAFQVASASIFGALVEVGTLVGTTFTPRWSGVASEPSWQGAELHLSAESIITLRHREIPSRIVTAQEFPGIPSESEGAPVPIIYGAVERSSGPSLLSDKDYLAGIGVRGLTGDRILSSTFVAYGVGTPSPPAPTATAVPVVGAIYNLGDSPYLPGFGNSDEPTSFAIAFLAGDPIYMEIVSGTGSGQERLVTSMPPTQYNVIGPNVTMASFLVGVGVAFDTVPDATSRIRFYRQPIGASVVVGDEATVSRVEVDVSGRTYPIAHTQGTLAAGIVSADVSAEFRFGEDYAAMTYYYPLEVRGVSALNDGLTASAGASVQALPYFANPFDAVAFGEVYAPDLCAALDGADADVYAFVSVSSSQQLRLYVSAIRWDGSVDVTDPSTDIGTGRNSYPPSVLPDGVPGAFGAYPFKLTLPRPIEEYERFRICVWVNKGSAVSMQTTTTATAWTNGATSVTVTAETPPVIGDKVRPYRAENSLVDQTIDEGSILVAGNYGGDVRNWRTITGVTAVSAGTYQLDFVDPVTCATGVYNTVIAPAAEFVTVTQYEVGFAAVYATIPRDSRFIVSTSAGRTYSGSPVTLARDAARDIFRRDLSVPLTDTATYASLPDDACSMALVDAEDSATILARMCREFNWVAGHNGAGQEVATAWLDRVFEEAADYSVTSADMVAGSITGMDATSIDDLVTLPTLRWSWTQADGYRQQGAVTEVSTDPATLTAENYLQTISGFGDYSTSLDAYQILHAAWQFSGIRRSSNIEYRYGGDPMALYVPRLMEWAASRKDIATFRVNDTHAAAAAYVGQRIAVSHKRYTAGGTAYGTLVATYWYPGEGQTQLTVMFDPFQVSIDAAQLYVDSLDASGATEQYIDQRDGVTTQYIDQIGV